MASKAPQEAWDVAVIGGGAAGMMAAGRAAQAGARVILIEKNATLGKKLLITGGGRCNLTNSGSGPRAFLAMFNSRGKAADRFLFSPFSRHGVADSLSFFNGRGLETRVEARGRVFPITDTAESVYDVLHGYMAEGNVAVRTGSTVTRVGSEDDRIAYVELQNGQRIRAASFIFATGGLSRPDTGSTGDGFAWLRALGHAVADPDPSLVPLTLRDAWAAALAGVSLADISLSIVEDGKKLLKQSGGLVFTHKGISGPAVLNLSKDVGERLAYGPVQLSLDLLPHTTLEALDERLLAAIGASSNKKIKNLLSSLIASALVPLVLRRAKIPEDTPAHSLSREQRIVLGATLKSIPLTVKGRLGFEKAIIASGGVALTDIDTKTMRSRRIPNLYIIGDLLDIDRPSGGYSLQLCWTTATVAGDAAAHGALHAKVPLRAEQPEEANAEGLDEGR